MSCALGKSSVLLRFVVVTIMKYLRLSISKETIPFTLLEAQGHGSDIDSTPDKVLMTGWR